MIFIQNSSTFLKFFYLHLKKLERDKNCVFANSKPKVLDSNDQNHLG